MQACKWHGESAVPGCGGGDQQGQDVLPPTHASETDREVKSKGPAARREELKTGGMSVPVV